MERVTNSTFAKTNHNFVIACEIAKIPPTARQASKFRRKTGLARKYLSVVALYNN